MVAELTSCPSCAAAIPAGARFCPSCGASVTKPTDERRVATIVFADVVGFTGLSERRDPEGVKYLLDRCFERLAADITAHGGRVDKIVGDELMAVFGAPIAHEDDPERAVRAALAMKRNLADHARETGAAIDVRIGVNTGEVVVGSLRAGGDLTALGDVVNTASRLQGSAEPGQILVGERTYEATKESISYESVGDLQLRGRGGKVLAWRALEALGPPGARPGRLRTPLFGRKAELGMLWHALGTTVEHRRPHLVLLVGEAGMGKTVLVQEAIEMARAQHGALVLEGRCLPYGEANPWWPVAEALRQACGIDPDDPADISADKCRAAVAGVLGTEDEGAEAGRVADGLLYLMGYEGKLHDVDPSRAREEVMRAIQLSLAANARQRPLVIVLSEIHWADQLVLDLIDTMLDRLRNLPIVVLATARPELEARWTPKPGRHNLFVLNLDALNNEDAAKLARSILQTNEKLDDLGRHLSGQPLGPHDAELDELVEMVVERSGGNPLFIYELATLLGEGATSLTSERRDVPELPATLRGLVAARIDALDHAERSVLEDAAVVGRNGTVDALVALAEARGETHGDVRLGALAERDLLVLEDGEFEFKSDLVRDVAYETLTKADRARRHAAVADWLGSYAARTEREEEHLERIAHHFAVAAELVGEIGSMEDVPEQEIRSRALDWIERAVERAETRELAGVSVHLLDHALALLDPADAARRARFLLSRARGLTSSRDMERAHADIAEALRLAEELDDGALRARALTVRGETEQKEGELTRSAATLEQAVMAWKAVDDRMGKAEALRLWGFTSIHRGELAAAERAISEALEISRELGDRKGEAWALQNLAWAAFSQGDNDTAEERLQASARMFEEIGDLGGRGWAVGLLGYVWYFKGRLEDAAEIAEASVSREFSQLMGDRWAHGMMLNLLASVRLWQGRTREALDRATEANRLFEQINDEMGLVNSAMILAYALTFSGRAAEARDIGERYLPTARATFGARLGAALTASTVFSITGDGERAMQIYEALRWSDEDDVAGSPSRALALLMLGRYDEAFEQSSIGWREEDAPGDRPNAVCIHALCAAAAGRSEEAVAAGEEVARTGVSYLDHIRAHIGRALALARLGRSDEAAAVIAECRRIANATDDVVHQLLTRLAEGVLDDTGGSQRAQELIQDVRLRLSEAGISAEPWEQAFRKAATA